MEQTEEFEENKGLESIDKIIERKFIKGVEMVNCQKCGKERISSGLKNGICFPCENKIKQ